MMTEIALNILDIAENSVKAEASLVEILVNAATEDNRLHIMIRDNGCGMTGEQLSQVEDPFFTTRKTRKVGLGIPFFKFAALLTGGDFRIDSQIGEGTCVMADFVLDHIDRMPLGDIDSTIYTLLIAHPDVDFKYTYRYNGRQFILDTREMREILGDIPFNVPEVSEYIKGYLSENKKEVDGGAIL